MADLTFYLGMVFKAAMAIWSIGFFWILALGTFDAFFGDDEELRKIRQMDELKVYLCIVLFVAAYWPVLVAAMASEKVKEKWKRRKQVK